MGVIIERICNFKKFEYTSRSTVHVYSDLEKGWTRTEQRVGSWYASTKSIEIEESIRIIFK